MVYAVATLGIVYDKDKNEQTIFGGGKVDPAVKDPSKLLNVHEVKS